MEQISKFAGTKIVSTFPGKRWRFVKTKLGTEYCVDHLLFKSGRLQELDCYRFDEYGTRFTVHLRPSEVEDMSEIAEFLTGSLS